MSVEIIRSFENFSKLRAFELFNFLIFNEINQQKLEAIKNEKSFQYSSFYLFLNFFTKLTKAHKKLPESSSFVAEEAIVGVGCDPRKIAGDSGVDTRIVGSAINSIADDANSKLSGA